MWWERESKANRKLSNDVNPECNKRSGGWLNFPRIRPRFVSCWLSSQSSRESLPVTDGEVETSNVELRGKVGPLVASDKSIALTLIRSRLFHLETVTTDTTMTLAEMLADPALQNLRFSSNRYVLLVTRPPYISWYAKPNALVASQTNKHSFADLAWTFTRHPRRKSPLGTLVGSE